MPELDSPALEPIEVSEAPGASASWPVEQSFVSARQVWLVPERSMVRARLLAAGMEQMIAALDALVPAAWYRPLVY